MWTGGSNKAVKQRQYVLEKKNGMEATQSGLDFTNISMMSQ